MRELLITEKEAGQRLDKMLTKYLNEAPKSFLYKMLRKKNIVLNGKKASGSEMLNLGDSVRLFLAEETIEKFSSHKVQNIKNAKQKLDILYEDNQILLLNKPVGMLSQKAKPEDVSAVEYVQSYLLESGQLTEQDLETFHPAVCNRLDRNTSGILAAGKTLAGLQELSLLFRDRTINKFYLALVSGQVSKSCSIHGYLKKDHARNQVKILDHPENEDSSEIHTEYRPLKAGKNTTLLEVHLITGKPHQIRAHLASIGHPVVGDFKYGIQRVNEMFKKTDGLKSQILHAYRLTFPVCEGALSEVSEKTFTAPLPSQFRSILEKEGVSSWEHGTQEV